MITYAIEKLSPTTYLVRAMNDELEVSRGILREEELLDQKSMALNLITEIDRVMNEQ